MVTIEESRVVYAHDAANKSSSYDRASLMKNLEKAIDVVFGNVLGEELPNALSNEGEYVSPEAFGDPRQLQKSGPGAHLCRHVDEFKTPVKLLGGRCDWRGRHR